MQIAGIIAEYNPFHNGHEYQLTQVRRETHADYLIIAMSGDFLQRGVPAMLDKYTRTQMALAAGADLVIELPARWAVSSAEFFGAAGVQLLGKTGVVSTICYGSENINPELTHALTAVLCEESDAFSALLQAQLKSGASYPAARSNAACRLLPDQNPTAIADYLASPNNILALEYEKAIAQWNSLGNPSLSGHPIRRIGEGYHSTDLSGLCASATAIRKHLFTDGTIETLRDKVPSFTYETLSNALAADRLLEPDDFSAALYARLWSLRETGYKDFADCSSSLSHKIVHQLDSFLGFTQFAQLLKSRDLTYTRICRALLHILLDIRKSDHADLWGETGIPYLRVLGFRRDCAPLLSAIKKEASVPLITKLADAPHILNTDAQKLLAQDIRCADLYRTTASMHCGRVLPNEYTQGLIIVP